MVYGLIAIGFLQVLIIAALMYTRGALVAVNANQMATVQFLNDQTENLQALVDMLPKNQQTFEVVNGVMKKYPPFPSVPFTLTPMDQSATFQLSGLTETEVEKCA